MISYERFFRARGISLRKQDQIEFASAQDEQNFRTFIANIILEIQKYY